MQIESANILLNSHVDSASEMLLFELNVSWNSTSLNVSMQTTTLEHSSETMSLNSLIHHIVVDIDVKTVFTSNQLNAFVNDIILFISVNFRNHIAQIFLDQLCQANDLLSTVNFFRLMISYLITTNNSAWFYRSSSQQNCALHDKDREIFSLNSSNRHSVNDSVTTSVAQAISTSASWTFDLSWTENESITSVLIAISSLSIWSTNNSIWAINVSSSEIRSSETSFSDWAAMKKVSRNMISLLIIYYYVIEIL